MLTAPDRASRPTTGPGRREPSLGEPADTQALGEDVWQQWTWLADLLARAGDPEAALAAVQSARERAGTDEERAQVEAFAVQLTDLLAAAGR